MFVRTGLDADIQAAYDQIGEFPRLLEAVDAVLARHGVSSARAAFERGGTRDFPGQEAGAVLHYRRALHAGLDDGLRVQCLVQLGSSLRDLDRSGEAVETLEGARVPSGFGECRRAT